MDKSDTARLKILHPFAELALVKRMVEIDDGDLVTGLCQCQRESVICRAHPAAMQRAGDVYRGDRNPAGTGPGYGVRLGQTGKGRLSQQVHLARGRDQYG